MASQQTGQQLSQLARQLFGAAAARWYGAIALELVAGVAAVILNFIEPGGDAPLVGALVVAALLVWAYCLRMLRFEDLYDTAETMRRQSVLSEGLGWPANPWQVNEWRRRAGSLRKRAETTVRESDYYETGEEPGTLKLLEMTLESAFFTRHQYWKLRSWLLVLCIGTLLLAGLAVLLALTKAVPDTTDAVVARVVYSVVPIVLGVDLLGWVLRLGRLIDGIEEVEKDLMHLQGTTDLTESQVMRLVSEYNCQVAGGFPIHDRLFSRWHDEIQDLWATRTR